VSAPRPLVFLHIPKTSGIAVAHAMVETIGAANVFFGFDRAFFGGFSDWESIPAESRAFIHFSPATLPADALVVRAHMSLSTLRAAYPTGRFMTVLREPVCRLLSHYVFWRGFTPGQHASWGGWGELSALARRPLEAFLADPRIACQIDNVATRLLLWPHALIPPDGPIDPAHDAALIAAAIAALDSLDFADASENPSFEANLGAWLGTSPRRARRNESAPMPAELRLLLDAALTPAATTVIAARTRLDVMLWHAVLARRAPGLDAAALRQAALLHGTARAAALLAG
jgi:hypothetical protein